MWLIGLGLVGSSLVVVVLVRLWFLWAPDRPVASLRERWAPAPSAFWAVDGMEVHYRDEGPSDDPAPVVLLHGTGSSLHTWDGWTAELLRDGRRVVRFDRPGFGLTGPSPTGDYRMPTSADFVGRFLDARQITRCVLVGSSSGGHVAWHFARRQPERVAALVLIAPTGMPRTTPLPLGLRLAQSRWLVPIFERILPRSMIAANLRGAFGDPGLVTPAMIERTCELHRRAGNRRALGQTLIQAAASDDSHAIAEITVPTLILWGERDAVVPPRDAALFQAAIAGSRLVWLPQLGHMPYEEAPEPTARVVTEFLADLPR